MIRVFIANVIEDVGLNRFPIVDELEDIYDPGAFQVHFIAPTLANGRLSRPTVITVAYSPADVLDSISNPVIDKLPPQKGNQNMPALPEQARADIDAIISNHGFSQDDIGVDFVTTVENIIKRLNTDNSLGRLKDADPLEWV